MKSMEKEQGRKGKKRRGERGKEKRVRGDKKR